MNEVERIATPCTEVELVAALRDGHRVAFGDVPSPERLGVAWSQIALESGRGKYIWNGNVGNITAGGKWIGDFYWLHVPPPDPPKMRFRSYPNILTGASDYWTLLFDHYASALVAFDSGSPGEAAEVLGRLKYFLAPIAQYEKGMTSLYAEGVRRGLFVSSSDPTPPPLDAA